MSGRAWPIALFLRAGDTFTRRVDAKLLSIDPVEGSRQSGSSSVAERQLPKLNVAGSIPVSRSIKFNNFANRENPRTPFEHR
jgi:hypothetical protein